MKIWFTDFWKEFYAFNPITTSLKEHGIDFTVTDDNPDLVFFTAFGDGYKKFSCPRVMFSAECTKTEVVDGKLVSSYIHPTSKYEKSVSDYVICNETPLSSKMVRYPTYAVHLDFMKHFNIPTFYRRPKQDFCSYFFGHKGYNGERERALKFLSAYKKVDVALNHTSADLSPDIVNFIEQPPRGHLSAIKQSLMSHYKFSLALEHTVTDAYITEKLIDGFIAGSVPIYRGPSIEEDFQGATIVEFTETQETLDRIAEIDNNESLRTEIISANQVEIQKKLPQFHSDLVSWFGTNFL